MPSINDAMPAGFSDDEDSDEWLVGGGGLDYGEVTPVVEGEKWTGQRGDQVYGRDMTDFMASMDHAASSTVVDKLKEAIKYGNSDQVAELIDSGEVSVTQRFYGLDGGSPLVVALQAGQARVVEVLLARNAPLAADDDSGISSLMALCATAASPYRGRELSECVDVLFSLRPDEVDVNARQSQGMTALMLAARQGLLEVCANLLRRGADVNARDTQEWSALCFAAGRGHGHVARLLLESGADPSFPTREGMVAAELAGMKGCGALQDIIHKFEKTKSLLAGQDLSPTVSTIPKKYSEVDSVLMGLNLGEYSDLFESHEVSLHQFLELSERDLTSIGIHKLGDRKRILDGIASIHRQDWERTSLPRLVPKDKQRGIYLTSPDCVTMMANIASHAQFISASLAFLHKQLCEHPELLAIGQDIADVNVLQTHVTKARENFRTTTRKLDVVRSTVNKLARNEARTPADLLKPPVHAVWKEKAKVTLVPTIAVVGGLYLAAKLVYMYQK